MAPQPRRKTTKKLATETTKGADQRRCRLAAGNKRNVDGELGGGGTSGGQGSGKGKSGGLREVKKRKRIYSKIGSSRVVHDLEQNVPLRAS